jgi:uncharacterized protein YceK
MIRRGLLSAALLGLTGCGIYFSQEMAGPRVYGAVRFDFQAVGERPGLVVLLPFDLPFSLVFDTICLPYTIYYSATYGERELNTIQGEASKPHGIVEGTIVEGDTTSFEVLTVLEWRQRQGRSIPGARVQIYGSRIPRAESAMGDVVLSDERGKYLLIHDWDPGWKLIRVDCNGFHPLEIAVSRLHDPTDQHYWSDHRLVIQLARP